MRFCAVDVRLIFQHYVFLAYATRQSHLPKFGLSFFLSLSQNPTQLKKEKGKETKKKQLFKVMEITPKRQNLDLKTRILKQKILKKKRATKNHFSQKNNITPYLPKKMGTFFLRIFSFHFDF